MHPSFDPATSQSLCVPSLTDPGDIAVIVIALSAQPITACDSAGASQSLKACNTRCVEPCAQTIPGEAGMCLHLSDSPWPCLTLSWPQPKASMCSHCFAQRVLTGSLCSSCQMQKFLLWKACIAPKRFSFSRKASTYKADHNC